MPLPLKSLLKHQDHPKGAGKVRARRMVRRAFRMALASLALAGCNPTVAPCVEPTIVEACEAQLIARCDAFANCCDAAGLDCDPWVYDPAACLAEWQTFGVDCSTADAGTASCADVDACEAAIAAVECSTWLGGASPPNLGECSALAPR